jgi:RNA-directed DNA polymerase
MAGVERFLSQRLKLTLNREKSRVAGSWMCDYLGYGMSWHQQPRLRVATMLAKKLWDRLGLVSILDTINRLNRIT